MPGTNYVRSINGKVIKPDFYKKRLTRALIKDELNKSTKNAKADIESYVLGNISFFSVENSTKANTLKN